jgi:hypothetical protein
MSTDRSPGLDGFNGDKRCRHLIAQDFYDLCQGFYEGKIYMQSINASHVLLVPKKDNPSKVGDFRPISLVNSSVKLLIELLANRL